MKHTCGGCDATWTGTNMAHCGGANSPRSCHHTFSSVALFDAHRAGGGGCQEPAGMFVKGGARQGQPLMRLNEHNVWVGNQPRPQFWETQGAAA